MDGTKDEYVDAIKSALLRDEGVYFFFCAPTRQDWRRDFVSFWYSRDKDDVWEPQRYDGATWDTSEDNHGVCHAVLITGYDETSPDRPAWLVLNSWGTDSGRRPHGTFRVTMDLPYDDWMKAEDGDYRVYGFATLDIDWGPNHLPVADAGGPYVEECTDHLGATVHLDGSGSSDPDSSPGTNDDIVRFTWLRSSTVIGYGETLDYRFPLGERDVTLEVEDIVGATDRDTARVEVRDTRPPEGGIVAPPEGACFGPSSTPVVVEDDFTDRCDPAVRRRYDPPGGPGYSGHGDYAVHLYAADRSGNESVATVSFTIDLQPPTVVLHEPPHRAVLPTLVPMRVLFTATDDDGASGGPVHEVVYFDGCEAFDGYCDGDGDGLLHDDDLVITVEKLCEIAQRCGQTEWHDPVVAVRAWDCGDNSTTAAHQVIGDFQLVGGVCGGGLRSR